MNRGEIRDRILGGLNDDADSPVFWSTSEINGVIDEAQEIICEEMEAVKRTHFLPMRDGHLYYFTQAIPNCMAPYRLYTTHNMRRLTATTVSQLDARNELWARVSGDPEVWAPIGWDCFCTYPHVATGGGSIRVDFLAWPRTLLDDDDAPEIPISSHDDLILYGVYDGLMKQWDSQKAAQMYQMFLQRVTKNRNLSMDRVGARTWQAAMAGNGNLRNSGNPWAT